jgi:hypothetical protein
LIQSLFGIVQRYSLEFKSVDWVSQSRRANCCLKNHSLSIFVVYIEALSCWNMTQGYKMKLGNYLLKIFFQDFVIAILINTISILHTNLGLWIYMHPQTIVLPPLCYVWPTICFKSSSTSYIQHQDISFEENWLILFSFQKIIYESNVDGI